MRQAEGLRHRADGPELSGVALSAESHHGPGTTQIPMPSNDVGPPTLMVRFVPMRGFATTPEGVQGGVPGGAAGITTLI